MTKILLKNARVVSSDGIEEKDVIISGGKILKVVTVGEGEDMLANIVDEKSERTFPSGEQDFPDENSKDFKSGEIEIIDLSEEGLYLLPGLIDTHVHFRDPGLTQKGDFETESKAALQGGITMIFDMPNTLPAVTSKEAFAEKVAIAKEKCKCDFNLYMAATEASHLSEIRKVLEDGELVRYLAGIKMFVGCSTGCLLGGYDVLETFLADDTLRFFKWDLRDGDGGSFIPIVVHAEDEKCLVRHASEVDLTKPENHSKARPVECAATAVRTICHLARKYNRPVHIAHVSSPEEIEIIEKFKDDFVEIGCEDGSEACEVRKVPLVTCEVSPHHLFLNDEMYGKLGWYLKVNPPVRSAADVRGLWQALYDGKVDMIGSDHSPHTKAEKGDSGRGCSCGMCDDVGDVSAGMPEVATTLPLLLNEVAKENLSLSAIVRLCCEKPVSIFGMHDCGAIVAGRKANLVVVDMKIERVVKASDLAYKCGWTCYEGWKLKGWPVKVIYKGKVV